MADFNLFDVPDYYGGLLGEQATQDLQKKALTTGLINAALGFIAQPRNQRYGSALPYLGKALTAGYESGQNVIAGGLKDWETKQKIAEMQRKKEQQAKLQTMIGDITNPQERLYAELAPEQYVAAKVKQVQTESPFAKIDRKDYTTESFKTYLQTGNLGDLEPIAKEPTQPSAVQEYNYAKGQGYKGSFEDWKKLQKSEGVTVNYGAPVAGVDSQGNPVFFQPSKTGGAPTIVSGVAPLREEKPATEAQAKAGAFASQMKTATNELDRLSKEGFDPTSVTSQISTAIASTPFTGVVNPQAQQANQSQQQWAEAYLRFKTGAAATEAEVKRNQRTFFPQVGDSDAVIKQKARARAQAEADVASAGKQPSTIKQSSPQQAPRSRADILKQYGL